MITAEGLQQGYQFKGYCAPKDLPQLDELCPSPLSLLRTGMQVTRRALGSRQEMCHPMFLGNSVRISDVAQAPTIVLDVPALAAYIAGMKATQYTIRNVPAQVDRVIRQKAETSHKSLNAVLLDILKSGAGMAEQPVEHHDLDELIGSWLPDPDFDAAMEAFESVDEDLWIAALALQHDLLLFTRDAHFDHLPQLPVI